MSLMFVGRSYANPTYWKQSVTDSVYRVWIASNLLLEMKN